MGQHIEVGEAQSPRRRVGIGRRIRVMEAGLHPATAGGLPVESMEAVGHALGPTARLIDCTHVVAAAMLVRAKAEFDRFKDYEVYGHVSIEYEERVIWEQGIEERAADERRQIALDELRRIDEEAEERIQQEREDEERERNEEREAAHRAEAEEEARELEAELDADEDDKPTP